MPMGLSQKPLVDFMQTTLFEEVEEVGIAAPDVSEWGTFKDSLKAPVHGWFTYPAGFSYKAVEHSLDEAGLRIGRDTVYDPFMGSGTTNLVAKQMGFHSAGVEAHPFVFEITETKMEWGLDLEDVLWALQRIEKEVFNREKPDSLEGFLSRQFPNLILKCFLPETLFDLMTVRDTVSTLDSPDEVKAFLKTALICALRDVSIAATGWPYIAPNKIKITSMSKKGWETYKNRVLKMYGDLQAIKKKSISVGTSHLLIKGDSRSTLGQIDDESVDHIFTSPPYLNNFDYADRTRLEMYFMGEAKSWGEISEKVRTKLMTSATTQISRTDPKYEFSNSFRRESPKVCAFLDDAVRQMAALRMTKGGKKSYDLLTTGYFSDIFLILKDNFRVLKEDAKALYILGDSAPYGVHIPTDELIGQIGLSIGFKSYDIQILRERGGKWEKNPQRHSVALRESVVILQK